MALFERYRWPGNIRQLANVLRTAAVMAAGEPLITEQHLSDDFLEDVPAACSCRARASLRTTWRRPWRDGRRAARAGRRRGGRRTARRLHRLQPPTAPRRGRVRAVAPAPLELQAEIKMIRALDAAPTATSP